MLPGRPITPAGILVMVRRHAWFIALPPLLAGFCALIYSSQIRDVFQAEMLVSIVSQRVPTEFVQSTVTLRTEERLDALSIEVLSRKNLELMIAEMNLYPNEREGRPLDDVVSLMRSSIDVGLEPVRRGPRGPEPPHAFHVRFSYEDPAVAADVTQRIGVAYVEQNVADRGALANATDKFLQNQLEAARARLEEQEKRLEAFRERHGNALPTQMPSNMQAIQTKQLQVQALIESTARDRDRKQMLERLYREAAKEAANPPTSVQPLAPETGSGVPAGGSARQRLETARASLTALELRYRPEHPDVVRARRLVAELEPVAKEEANQATRPAAEDREPAAVVDPTRREQLAQMAAEIESLDRQASFKESEERRLRQEIAEYQGRVEAVPGLESEWTALTRDYRTNQDAYTSLLAKADASRVAVKLEENQIGEQFKIVDPARVPARPVSLVRAQVNGIGFGVGLLVGLLMAAIREFRDRSFWSDADVLEILELPVLAVVPQIVTERERARQRSRQWMWSIVGATCVAGVAYVTWALKLWNTVI